MRTTDEIMHKGETLTEILRLHKMWLYGKNEGRRADLRDSDLSGADLRDSDLRGADLRDSDLSGADLRDSDLIGADLSGADLRDSDLSGADLRDSDLSGADLRDSDLIGANLSGADLRDSDLRDAELRGAELRWANLRDSDLSGAKFIYKGVEAKRFQVFNNLYRYCVYAILSTDGAQYVRLGCKFYSREDWMAGKGDNHDEFPDDCSEGSELRKFALSTAFAWLDLIAKQEEKKDVRSNQL